MTRIGSGAPPPTLTPTDATPAAAPTTTPPPSFTNETTGPADTVDKQKTATAEKKPEHAPAPETSKEEVAAIAKRLDFPLGTPLSPAAPPWAMTLPDVRAPDLLLPGFVGSEAQALIALDEANLPLDPASARALKDLADLARAEQAQGGDVVANDPAVKEFLAELKKMWPSEIKHHELRALVAEQKSLIEQQLTPAFLEALKRAFPKLPPHVAPAFARMTPGTVQMYSTLSDSEGVERQEEAEGDEALADLIRNIQPVKLPRYDETVKAPPGLSGLADRLLADPTADIETLMILIMGQIRSDNQTDVKEQLVEMKASREKKDRMRTAMQALRKSEAQAEADLQLRYNQRTALPPSDPDFIDATKVTLDAFKADQALIDQSTPPLGASIDGTTPSYGFGLADDVQYPPAPPPAPGDSEAVDDGTIEAPGAPPPPEQTLAQRWGMSQSLMAALEDFARTFGFSDANTLLTMAAPSGIGGSHGDGVGNRAKIEAFVNAFRLKPTYGDSSLANAGMSVNDVASRPDLDDAKYYTRPSGPSGVTGSTKYKDDAQAVSAQIAAFAQQNGVDTSQLDVMLRNWFIALHNKSRNNGHNPNSVTWYNEIRTFLQTLPVAQRAKYVQYVELRTTEFLRDIKYLKIIEDDYQGNGLTGTYPGVFLTGADKNLLAKERFDAEDGFIYEDQLEACMRAVEGFLKPTNPMMRLADDQHTFARFGAYASHFLPEHLREGLPGGRSDAHRLEVLEYLVNEGKLDEVLLIAYLPGIGVQLPAYLQPLMTMPKADALKYFDMSADAMRESKLSDGLFEDALESRDAVLDALDDVDPTMPLQTAVIGTIVNLIGVTTTISAPTRGVTLAGQPFGAPRTRPEVRPELRENVLRQEQEEERPPAPGRQLKLADIAAELESLQNQMDSQSDLSEEMQLRLQILMDRLSQVQTTLSNALKKQADTASGIISNLK